VVLIETRGMRFGWAQIEELRAALLALRQHGGEVYAYLEGGSLRHYFMATAADKVLAHPTTSLSILGMRIQAFFFAELLAKLGAKAEFVRIAEYKSYPETLERNTASPPTASQRKLLVSDIWNHVLRRIARDRGHEPRVIKEWIDAAPLHPPRAIRDGVIDALAYPDQIDEKLEEWLGRKVRIQKPSKQREHEHLYGPPPRIAVLLIEGDILDSESFEIPILGRKVAGSYTLTREIERLREDDGVRAVVVRIDSPGGSVTASEAIARELDLTRAEKPVVISMGNACASGGYYIATGGQYVFADATTVTGSIGIFYPKVDLSGTLEMFGVHVDAFNFGRRAGLRSWFKPYSEDEWAAALGAIEDDYAVFVERVARARSMTLARVDNVARGRVWSGVRALEIGLVDQYGGLSDAIGRARAIAGLQPREAEVVLYPKKPGLIENLRRIFEIDLPLPIGEAEVGRAAFSELRPGSLGIPSPILLVLRHLPIPLWWSPGPQPLALAEETLVLAD
jgi:protease-4